MLTWFSADGRSKKVKTGWWQGGKGCEQLLNKTQHRMTQIYMILAAVGAERGQPCAVFFDPFAARRAFDEIDGTSAHFTGNRVAFLVAYEILKNGQLMELEEIGCK
jgi:hypothetical protein